MTPKQQQQLVDKLNANDAVFDIDQFRGYMVALALAPAPIPAQEWSPILLSSVAPEEISPVAHQLKEYFDLISEQLASGRYRLPTLGSVDAVHSIFDGQQHKLRQWAAGFQAGATDFIGYWQVGGDGAAQIHESLMVLGCLAFEESAQYFAEEMGVNIVEFVEYNRKRMLQALNYLRGLEKNTRSAPTTAHPKDPHVEVLLTTRDPKQQVAIAQAIVSENAQCAEAWDVLARLKSESTDQVQQCLEHAVSAAEHQLGQDYIEYYKGQLWQKEEARILLQTLVGLGACYKQQKRYEKSAACYEKALLLDAEDNVGAQAALLTVYFLLDRYDAVANILAYYDAHNAWALYSRALLSYVRDGNSDTSKFLKSEAVKANKYVAKYLAGRSKLPNQVGMDYKIGSKDEAAIYAEDAREAWRKIIGSIAWLLS